MRSISASTSAISFNAAGDSVVLGCWACDVAMAPLTRIMMDVAAVHAFIRRNLVSRIGIPRMNPELAWMVAIFWIGRKPRCEDGSGIPDCPNGVRGSHYHLA